MTELAAWLPALAALGAAALTGWLALRTKHVEVTAPESVAAGYSRLLSDNRQALGDLRQRIQHLEDDRLIDKARIITLERMVGWMMVRLSEDDQADFHRTFDPPSKEDPS